MQSGYELSVNGKKKVYRFLYKLKKMYCIMQKKLLSQKGEFSLMLRATKSRDVNCEITFLIDKNFLG